MSTTWVWLYGGICATPSFCANPSLISSSPKTLNALIFKILKTLNLPYHQRKYNWIILYVSTILFLIAGLTSAYLFHMNEEDIQINALFPGLIFTSTTIIIFIILRIDFSLKNCLLYYVLMYVTYLTVYYVTYMTVWYGFLTGILTGGFGALVTFKLINKFILKISYDKRSVFVFGGLAFLINDILLIEPVSKLIEPVYIIRGWVHTIYAPTFLFWQFIIGTKLSLILQKKSRQSSAYNIESGDIGAL